MLYLEFPSGDLGSHSATVDNEYGAARALALIRSATSGFPDEVPRRPTRASSVSTSRAGPTELTAYHYNAITLSTSSAGTGYLNGHTLSSIGDFEADHVTGPPSAPFHQTFAARNSVVCSFVPRKFDTTRWRSRRRTTPLEHQLICHHYVAATS